jgi:hypothetical protein
MSMELEAVIESCISMLESEPHRTREEMALLLNRWEEVGYINRQIRAVIVRRLQQNQQEKAITRESQDIVDSQVE